MKKAEKNGPLSGIRIVEFASIGPGPFAAMMLADHGADVVRIERRGASTAPPNLLNLATDPTRRGRRLIELDVKEEADKAIICSLVQEADGIIEGFRPGTMERLGLGPDVLMTLNPMLVYGRMTGWGQEGPLAKVAGHDINYISLTGALDAIGTTQSGPVPPLNLVGDYGGGGMLLAFGMVSALLHAKTGGEGQVIDAAMVDGAALMMALPFGLKAAGHWNTGSNGRGRNFLDGGAPYYGTYACADGKWLAVGPIEPQFFAAFCELMGLSLADEKALARARDNSANWAQLKALLVEKFAEQCRAFWEEAFAGSDACVTPVLAMDEAGAHPHIAARGTFAEVDGYVQPAPAPIFSGERAATRATRKAPENVQALLTLWRSGRG